MHKAGFHSLVLGLFMMFSHHVAAQPLGPVGSIGAVVKVGEIKHCIALIDEQKLTIAKRRGSQLDKEISAKCQQGERNKAQNSALGFAHEIQKSRTLIAYRKCTKKAQPPYNQMHLMLKRYFISNLRFTHVCDTF